MRITTLLTAMLLSMQCATAQFSKNIEEEVIAELNFARTNPQRYAKERLETFMSYFTSSGMSYIVPGQIEMTTNEGVDAVKACVRYMKKARPIGKLKRNSRLSKAAQEFADDSNKNNIMGHVDSHGKTLRQRLSAHGFGSYTGECCSYGNKEAVYIVIQLLVDDGVASRGHRELIMDPNFNEAGVGVAEHPSFDFCAVIDFADK